MRRNKRIDRAKAADTQFDAIDDIFWQLVDIGHAGGQRSFVSWQVRPCNMLRACRAGAGAGAGAAVRQVLRELCMSVSTSVAVRVGNHRLANEV